MGRLRSNYPKLGFGHLALSHSDIFNCRFTNMKDTEWIENIPVTNLKQCVLLAIFQTFFAVSNKIVFVPDKKCILIFQVLVKKLLGEMDALKKKWKSQNKLHTVC